MFVIRAQIERLSPDRVRVDTRKHADLVVARLLENNSDRDIRVTVTHNGDVVAVVERKVSSFAPSNRRQPSRFYA